METRTVWQMVWDDYQKWLYKTLRGFGPFSLDRKKNSAIGLSKVVNSILAIIGTPWIIAHWVAFCNKNVRPQRTCNKVGYWIALIVALIFDLIPLAILALFMWVRYNHPVYGIEKWFTILFVFAPLFYAGVSKLPYLFMNDPIIREEEHQNQETEIEYLTDYEDDEEQEEEETDRRYARGRAYTPYRYDNSECKGIEDSQYDEDERIDIDKMDGATFEHFCADLLRVNGWTDVRVTPASGDHGIDITAEKDDIKWGFQCKRWGDTKVDAIAIGQTYKGKALYECDMVAVITTSTLTAQAEGEAKQLGIKVWGRGKIRQLMSKLHNADDYYLSA